LINGFIDVNVPYLNGFGATPYFGGGIGAGQTNLDLKVGDRTIVNSSDWNLAYQLGAGINYKFMPNWSLDIGYRYKGTADVTLHNDNERIIVPNRSHNFEVSLLYKWQPLGAPVVAPYTPPPVTAPYVPPPTISYPYVAPPPPPP
jgi:opacity protein-like surface antigen